MSSGVPCVHRTLSVVKMSTACTPNRRVSGALVHSTSTLVIHAHAQYSRALLGKDHIRFVTATAVNCSRVSATCYTTGNVQ